MSSKHRVVVLKIVAGGLTVSAAAAEYGMSRQYLHKLLARYRDEGLDGLDARTRAPKSSPHAVTDRVRERIVQLRQALAAAGTDAGRQSPANAPDHRSSGSKPHNPTRPGSPTSHTGASRTAPTWRS